MIAELVLLIALADSSTDPVVLRLEHLTNCGNWTVALHASGTAKGQLFNACHPGGPKRLTLDRSLTQEVSQLRALVEKVRFVDLAERPPEAEPIVDDAMCVLEVEFVSVRHSVTISDTQLGGGDRTLEPFRKVWRAVQAMMPEPAW